MSPLPKLTIRSQRFALVLSIAALAMLAALLGPRPTYGGASDGSSWDAPGLVSDVTALAAGDGASISGTVTDENTGEPLEGICVELFSGSDDWLDYDRTDASGHYSLVGLSAGWYKVYFIECSAPRAYFPEWYDDQPKYGPAELLMIAEDEKRTGVDAALRLGGAISGTVTDENTGEPIEGICLWVDGPSFGWGETDALGRYSVGGLVTGDYRVQFYDCGPLAYFSEWYDDQPDNNSADLVAVTEKTITAGVDAALTLGGAISGTVTDENTGDPLEDICVSAYDSTNHWMGQDHSTRTDASGHYGIGGLPTGDYKLAFRDCSDHPAYFSEWHSDQPDVASADLVAAIVKQTTVVDAALTLGGAITGTVTDENTGEPLEGICVRAYSALRDWTGARQTDPSGRYHVGRLTDGEYKVRFVDCGSEAYFTEWHSDQTDFYSADPVAAAVKRETVVDAALTLGGAINGTVTDENTGELLEGICVSVYEASGRFVGNGGTDASGHYSVVGLPSGSYKLHFRGCYNPHAYLSEWYNDRPDSDSADLVTVTEKGEASADVDLTLGGVISVTVIDENTGDPLDNICVEVYDGSNRHLRRGYTDASGYYRAVGLHAGEYKLSLGDCNHPAAYLSEWYDARPDRASADVVTVALKQETAIEIGLTRGGVVKGTVTDENTGEPLENTCVSVHGSSHGLFGSDRTDIVGRYTVGALPTGEYKVSFYDCSAAGYLSEWHHNQPDSGFADTVAVAVKDETVVDASLTLGGTISGTVTDENTGEPLRGVCVSVFDESRDLFDDARTNVSGQYSVGRLPAGEYTLEFEDCGYPRTHRDEWYDGRPDIFAADPVTIAAKESVVVDAGLIRLGTISGTVTDENTGEPLDDICVSVYNDLQHRVRSGDTNAPGYYSIAGLPAGDYKLHFEDCNYGARAYFSEWYHDQPDFDSADPVAVTDKHETTVDAGLTRGGTISGTVTDENTGEPLEDICVTVYDSSGGVSGDDRTDASGYYSVGELSTGDHVLRFKDCRYPRVYLAEWYNDQPDFDSADLVAVTEKEKTAVDVALARGGTITGTVTDENTGEPLDYICVTAYDSTNDSSGRDRSNLLGHYSIRGLPTGDYKLYFEDCNHPRTHLPEWYDDQPDIDTADAVAVTEKEETVVDVGLTLGGVINGTVTDENTGELLDGICVTVYDSSGGESGDDRTDASGYYSVAGLSTGDHVLHFKDCRHPYDYFPEWYDDRLDFDSADPVAVTEKETTVVDVGLTTLGGTISGTVTDENTGEPLREVCAKVYDSAHDFFGGDRTDAQGHYSVGGLPPGGYKILLVDCNYPRTYLTEWYDARPDFDSADLVSAAPKQKTVVDIGLSRAGTISGTVTNENTDEPLEGVCVRVYDSAHDLSGTDRTDALGYYRVGGLSSGDYKLYFEDCTHPYDYFSEWYDDRPDFDSADVVTAAAKDNTVVDIGLTSGGAITGTVTEESTGDPLEGICVGAYETPEEWSGLRRTDASGHYSISGLPAGEYRLRFSDCDYAAYEIEWYDSKPDFDSADPVTVTDKQTTAGVDAALAAATDVDFSIEVAGTDCGTQGGDMKCDLELGEAFTLNVYLNGLPSAMSSYDTLEISLRYLGVGSRDNGHILGRWDDCSFQAAYYEPGFAHLACVTYTGTSTYTGIVATLDFTCDASGRIVLAGLHPNETGVSNGQFSYHEGADERLTINCVEPPTPTPTPTLPPIGGVGVFPDAPGAAASGGGAQGVVGAAMAASVAGAVALAGIAWYRRARLRKDVRHQSLWDGGLQ